jgi:ATPase family associated with various cellular activities (AAA)
MSTNLDIDELQHVYARGLVDIALAVGEPVRLDQVGVLEGDFDDFLSNGVDVEQFIADAAAECNDILTNDIASLSSLTIEGSDNWIDGQLRLAFRHLLLADAVTYLRVAALARYFGADYDRVLAIAREEIVEGEQDSEEPAESGGDEDLDLDDATEGAGNAEPDGEAGPLDETEGDRHDGESLADPIALAEKIKIALQYLIDRECLTPANVAGLARHFAVSRARIDQLAQTLARSSTSISGVAGNDNEQADLATALTTNTDGWVGVVGMQERKATLERDVIGPLREPDLYRKYRLTLPNGFLFYGPPGCGKTFIARKLAERLGRAFKGVQAGRPRRHVYPRDARTHRGRVRLGGGERSLTTVLR